MTTFDIIFNCLASAASCMIMICQGIKINQLRKQLSQKSNPTYGTLDYYYQDELSRTPDLTQVVLVVTPNRKFILPVKYRTNPKDLAQSIYNLTNVHLYRELLPLNKQLELDKQNLLEERKKLQLMEESLAKKEQEIIEMELTQELNS